MGVQSSARSGGGCVGIGVCWGLQAICGYRKPLGRHRTSCGVLQSPGVFLSAINPHRCMCLVRWQRRGCLVDPGSFQVRPVRGHRVCWVPPGMRLGCDEGSLQLHLVSLAQSSTAPVVGFRSGAAPRVLRSTLYYVFGGSAALVHPLLRIWEQHRSLHSGSGTLAGCLPRRAAVCVGDPLGRYRSDLVSFEDTQ